MPTQITQIDSSIDNSTTLRVEGELRGEDAVVLETIGNDIIESTGRKVVIDLADLDVIDSDAAPILRRIQNTTGFELTGMEIFLQSVVNQAERTLV